MLIVAAILIVLLLIGAYFLFRDTMNKIQYLERCRIYWVTRDIGKPGTPRIKRAWMREVESPWHRGSGVEFRVGRHTFQVGVLTGKVNGLHEQISNLTDFDPSVEEIRNAWLGRGWDDETT